jgi:hypothetical protein
VKSGVTVGEGVIVGVEVLVEVGSGVFVAAGDGVAVGTLGALPQADKSIVKDRANAKPERIYLQSISLSSKLNE